MIQINFRDPRPIYEQVKDGLRQMILSGILPDKSKMPSVRELAASLTINPNTIQRAYRELEAEGYICPVPGKGSFVSGREEALNVRRAQLAEELRKTARELRSTGMSEAELLELLKGETK